MNVVYNITMSTQYCRCTICSSKYKLSKLVEIGEEQFCEACFRRQFLLRSAIEHFMVPSIQECVVEVPGNLIHCLLDEVNDVVYM